jgi:hypothetical protein
MSKKSSYLSDGLSKAAKEELKKLDQLRPAKAGGLRLRLQSGS